MIHIIKALLLTITLPVALTVATTGNPAKAACQFKFQNCGSQASGPSRYVITNTARQRLGDIYDPGPGRRLQIRDNSLRILGYIEKPSGRITNTARQPVAGIEKLID